MKNWLIAAGMLSLLPAAFGIGRSGNGTLGSIETGFVAGVPENFEDLQPLKDQKLRLISFILEPAPSGLQQPFLELSDAAKSLPALAALPRSALPREMEKLGWKKAEHPDPCVESFLQSTESSLVLAFFWGEKKGLVVVGPQSPHVRRALEEIRTSLYLSAGACTW